MSAMKISLPILNEKNDVKSLKCLKYKRDVQVRKKAF